MICYAACGGNSTDTFTTRFFLKFHGQNFCWSLVIWCLVPADFNKFYCYVEVVLFQRYVRTMAFRKCPLEKFYGRLLLLYVVGDLCGKLLITKTLQLSFVHYLQYLIHCIIIMKNKNIRPQNVNPSWSFFAE